MQKQWAVSLIMAFFIGAIGCASVTRKHTIIKDATPLSKDAVASIQPSDFEAAHFRAADGTILPYRVLRPSEAIRGKSYPLILQLHGSGGIGTDNVMQLDRVAKSWAMPNVRSRYQAYVLIPQFPIRSANYGPTSPDQHAEHSSALNAALELVEEFVSQHPVDASRVYSVGFSMGGSAAWLAPTLRPNLFAGIVPISGIAPDNSFAPIFKEMPVLIVHGNADAENPITADRRFSNEVARIGGKNMRFAEYEGLDHQLPAEIFPGYWWRDWLFEQTRQ